MTYVLAFLLGASGSFGFNPGDYTHVDGAQERHDVLQTDPFAEQVIDPTVEIVLAVGNLAFTGYNGWQLAANRRNHFVAGLGVISGTVGIALGLHEASTHPILDLAAGAAAVVSGGLVMLNARSTFLHQPYRAPLPRVLRERIRLRPSLLRGVRLTVDL